MQRIRKWLTTPNTPYILAYILLPFVAFWRNFDLSGLNLSFFHVDFIGYYYPDYVQGVQVLQNILSFNNIKDILWDPYNFLGFPLLGAVDRIGLFYPVRLLFYLITMIFPQKYWIFFATYYSLFHMSIAGIGTFLFVKNCLKFKPSSAFVAGLVYCFSGSLLFVGIFTNVVTGPAMLPLQLYCMFRAYERKSWKWAIIGGFVSAPLLLSGYTSTFIYNNMLVSLFVLLYFVRDLKGLLKFASYVVIFNIIPILLSLSVLLPSIELKTLAVRQQLNLLGASGHSFALDGLTNYVIPYLFGIENSGNMYAYIGIIPLVLVFIAFKYSKNAITLIASSLAFLFFVLSTANFTFIYDIFYKLVPFYSQFRFHSFLQYLVAFCIALLAGKGMSLILEYKISPEQATSYFKRLLTFFVLTLVFFTLMKTVNMALFNLPVLDTVISAITKSLFFIAAGFLVIHFGYESKSRLVGILLTIIILLDLFTLISRTPYVNSLHDPRTFNSKSEVIERYENTVKLNSSRMYLHESTLRYNSAVEKINQIGGFHGLTPLAYSTLVDYHTKDFWIPPKSPLLDIWGVQYIFTTRELKKDELTNVELVEKQSLSAKDNDKFLTTNGTWVAPKTDIFVYENIDYIPHAHLVTDWKTVSTDSQALKLMNESDLHKTAIITSDEQIITPPSKDQKLSDAILMTYRSSYAKVQTTNDDAALLVLSDSYYPGWSAYIDGKKSKIYKTNIATRGVFVPAGEHIVEFVYNPWSLYIGIVISGITVLVTFLVLRIKK